MWGGSSKYPQHSLQFCTRYVSFSVLPSRCIRMAKLRTSIDCECWFIDVRRMTALVYRNYYLILQTCRRHREGLGGGLKGTNRTLPHLGHPHPPSLKTVIPLLQTRMTRRRRTTVMVNIISLLAKVSNSGPY